jgi:hypothetical protein
MLSDLGHHKIRSTMTRRGTHSEGWSCYEVWMNETSLPRSEPEVEPGEDWAAVKLLPRRTGLPMAVWITENEGYPHDVRVKVSTLHGGRGFWRSAPSVGVRPQPHEIIPGSLTAADVALVSRWIELNRRVIIEFWDGVVEVVEAAAQLQKLDP